MHEKDKHMIAHHTHCGHDIPYLNLGSHCFKMATGVDSTYAWGCESEKDLSPSSKLYYTSTKFLKLNKSI